MANEFNENLYNNEDDVTDKRFHDDGMFLQDHLTQIPQIRLHTPVKLKIRTMRDTSTKKKNEKLKNNQLKKDFKDICKNEVPRIFLIPFTNEAKEPKFELKNPKIIVHPVNLTLNIIEK